MRVLVVDDISVHSTALALNLARVPSIDQVDTAADADAALDLLAGTGDTADGTVALINMSMPSGIGILDAMVVAAPKVPVIAFGVSDGEPEIVACAQAGAAGCLLKGESYADLLAMVTSVSQGETRLSQPVAAALLRRVAALSKVSRADPAEIRLTTREREVMQLIDAGLANKQIARRLSIELRTVKNHVQHILAKYQVHRRGDAVSIFRGGRPSGAESARSDSAVHRAR
jgi:DNA-binding NarL/FixJ family response regulator